MAELRAALEVERKYHVDVGAAVPDLSVVKGVQAVDEPVVQDLAATYFDTADLRLRAAGITLRRRTGGSDAGWHLKLPAGGDREEIAVDLQDDLPEALAALVRVRVRGRPLAPVADLTTRRTVHRLRGADGQVLAELADDVVTGRTLPDGEQLRWREWEVELVDAPRGLLDAVQERLSVAGAQPPVSGSKLARVLPRPPAAGDARPWWAGPAGPSRSRTAGAVVQEHLAEQVAELLARDPQVRRDLPDAVHKMRVASRRLRSALATFRPLLERAQTDPLRDELRWLAAVLGGARDAEVMHARLLGLVAGEPPELVLGDVLARIETVMTKRYRQAHDALLRELDGERYLGLLDRLDALAAAPPFLEAARGEAPDQLAPLVRRAWRRLDRVMTAATRAPRGDHRDELLHEVRKDAKRARYAAESVQPVFGKPAGRFAAAMTELQESLGDFQDGVVTRAVLRELGAAGHSQGRNGFTFGRLHALEQVRAEAAVARFPQARAAVAAPKLRRWFDR